MIILQTVSPDYRAKFYAHLYSRLGNNFILYSGDRYFQKAIKSDISIKRIRVHNFFFLKRKVLFQAGVFWKEVFTKGIIVIELNPRIISNWAFLILRRFFGLKTYVWGHVWPRKGPNYYSENIRFRMQRLASGTITYTATQKKELLKKHPKLKAFTAPNSLFFEKEHMFSKTLPEEIKNIIYVGRLTPEKKPFFLLKSIHKLLLKHDTDIKLIIVGDGPEANKIKEYILIHHLSDHVYLKGHISNNDELRKLYKNALFSVSPGYVGLSITQSFAFGVPMLISRDENHSPEIEAAKEELNATFFETDNGNDLVNKVKEMFLNKNQLIQYRKDILDHCKNKYSIEKMTMAFTKLLTKP